MSQAGRVLAHPRCTVRASSRVHVASLKLLNSAHPMPSHLFNTKTLPSFVKTRCSGSGQACPAASRTPPSPAHFLYLLGAPGLRGRTLEVQSIPVSTYKSNSSHMGSRADGPRHRPEEGARDAERGGLPWGPRFPADPATPLTPSLSPLTLPGPGRSTPKSDQILTNPL